MGDADLDDDIGLDLVDPFLQTNQVFRKLDDRPSEPGECVDVLEIPPGAKPCPGNQLKRLLRSQGKASGTFGRFKLDGLVFEIDMQFHNCPAPAPGMATSARRAQSHDPR